MSSSPETSINILEVGYGSRPAVREGTIFGNPAVNYIGLELPKDFAGSFRYSDDEDFTKTNASMDAMPFSDESFDYVLMRSMYGQFRSRPEVIMSVRGGIFECLRVLKVGGQIIVSEENTPEDQSYVTSELKCAGFVIKAAEYIPRVHWENMPENNPWRTARGNFYDGEPRGVYGGIFGTPHVVIGAKPEGLKLETTTRRVVTNFYRADREHTESKSRDLVFKMPVRE